MWITSSIIPFYKENCYGKLVYISTFYVYKKLVIHNYEGMIFFIIISMVFFISSLLSI